MKTTYTLPYAHASTSAQLIIVPHRPSPTAHHLLHTASQPSSSSALTVHMHMRMAAPFAPIFHSRGSICPRSVSGRLCSVLVFERVCYPSEGHEGHKCPPLSWFAVSCASEDLLVLGSGMCFALMLIVAFSVDVGNNMWLFLAVLYAVCWRWR